MNDLGHLPFFNDGDRISTAKLVLSHSVRGLQEEFGDEVVAYAMLELLTDGLPDADASERDRTEQFLAEALNECINTADKRVAGMYED